MLKIYNPLVDRIKNHLKNRGIKADVKSCIGQNWHIYRWIQVIPDGIDSEIHYEYINNHWELHFEFLELNDRIDSVRQRYIDEIELGSGLSWEPWRNRQKAYIRLEEEVFNDSFEKIFDSIYDYTISDLRAVFNGKSEDKLLEIEANRGEDQMLENSLDTIFDQNLEYKKPDEPKIVPLHKMEYGNMVIPSYQRPYKWGIRNVNQLINDIINFSESGVSEYRLGTIVLHKLVSGKQLDIVDGQQRTITLLLLLNELMNKEEFSPLFPQDFKEEITVFLKRKSFHDAFSRIHLIDNLNIIKYRIRDFKKEHVDFLLRRCSFVVVTLYDISEAFQFFDSQNARGKELEPHDLLKAYHLREIKEFTQEDKANITKWEETDSVNQLTPLFLLLFRIRRWIGAKEGRFFTSDKIDIFKGYNSNSEKNPLPYQKIFLMADCYTHLYNNDISRKFDRQSIKFPHQIDQITINGSLFFDMICHYRKQWDDLKELISSYDILKVLDNYKQKDRDGDIYIRLMFDAAVLFYYDKFGTEGLEKAVEKIFLWAYSVRLQKESVRLETMDNCARESNSAFIVIHNAKHPSDLLDWQLPQINSIVRKELEGIRSLFEKLNHISR